MDTTNKPVAWMHPTNELAISVKARHANVGTSNWIPLYTHPANIIAEILEKNKPEIEKANAYIKSLEDEIKALKAKTLTDEEIEDCYQLWRSLSGDPAKLYQSFKLKEQEK
jgi:hypothetical protein